MTIEPINGEPTRFRVQSRSRPKHPHLVDIAESAPLGFCDCEAFIFKYEPEYKKAKEKPAIPKRCAHLVLARETALNLTLAQHAKI